MASRLPAKDGEGKRAYPAPTAPTLLETMWGRLDEITAELIRDYSQDIHNSLQNRSAELGQGEGVIELHEFEEDAAALKGEALGVAWCISVVESPYAPNVDAVRAEAMRRYKANQRG
jgi:hypothetical protein